MMPGSAGSRTSLAFAAVLATAVIGHGATPPPSPDGWMTEYQRVFASADFIPPNTSLDTLRQLASRNALPDWWRGEAHALIVRIAGKHGLPYAASLEEIERIPSASRSPLTGGLVLLGQSYALPADECPAVLNSAAAIFAEASYPRFALMCRLNTAIILHQLGSVEEGSKRLRHIAEIAEKDDFAFLAYIARTALAATPANLYAQGGTLDDDAREAILAAFQAGEKLIAWLQGRGYPHHVPELQRNQVARLAMLGELNRGISRCKALLASTDDSETKPHRVVVTRQLANLYKLAGDVDNATRSFEAVYAMAKEIGDTLEMAEASFSLGSQYGDLKDHEKAMHFSKHAAELYEKGEAFGLAASAWEMVGYIRYNAQQWEIASSAFQKAFDLYMQSGNNANASGMLLILADISIKSADLKRARAYYLRAYRIASKADKDETALFAGTQYLLMAPSSESKSDEYYLMARMLLNQAEEAEDEATTTTILGLLENFSLAKTDTVWVAESLGVKRARELRKDNPDAAAAIHVIIGERFLNEGHHEKGIFHYRYGARIQSRAKQFSASGRTLTDLAKRLYNASGIDAAVLIAQEARKEFQKGKLSSAEGHLCYLMAWWYGVEAKQWEPALELAQTSCRLFQGPAARSNLAQATFQCGMFSFQLGQTEEALAYWTKTRSLYKTLQNRAREAFTLVWMAGCVADEEKKSALLYESFEIAVESQELKGISASVGSLGISLTRAGKLGGDLDTRMRATLRRHMQSYIEKEDFENAGEFSVFLAYYDEIAGRTEAAVSGYSSAVSLFVKAGNVPRELAAKRDLAELYLDAGRLGAAKALYSEVFGRSRQLPDDQRAQLGDLTNQMQRVHEELGDYATASRLLPRAQASTDPADLERLARLHWKSGNLARVPALFEQLALLPGETAWTKMPHAYLANTSLAEFYLSIGELDKARSKAQAAFDLVISTFPNERSRPELSEPLTLLARLSIREGTLREADKQFKEALALQKGKRLLEHELIADLCDDVAGEYLQRGEYDKAEKFWKQAIEHISAIEGADQRDLIRYWYNLALIYHDTGDYPAALTYAKQAFERNELQIQEALNVLSERQRAAYFNENNDMVAFSFLVRLSQLSTKDLGGVKQKNLVNELIARWILRQKGILFDAVYADRLRSRGSAEASALQQQLDAARQRLATLLIAVRLGAGDVQLSEALAACNDECDVLARQLADALSKESTAAPWTPPDYPDVTAALPDGVILIELARFLRLESAADMYRLEQGGETNMGYMALIVSAESLRPTVLDLGDAAEIDRLLAQHQKSMQTAADPSSELKSLYRVLWSPIKPHAEQHKAVIISPDGPLSFLAWGMLMNEAGRYLIEDLDVYYVATGRDLTRPQKTGGQASAVLFGNPEFGGDAVSASFLDRNGVSRKSASLSALALAPLPGTETEVHEIDRLMRQSGIQPVLHMGSQATEERLKAVESPRMLHIATHGFFVEESAAVVELAALDQNDGKGWHWTPACTDRDWPFPGLGQQRPKGALPPAMLGGRTVS